MLKFLIKSKPIAYIRLILVKFKLNQIVLIVKSCKLYIILKLIIITITIYFQMFKCKLTQS